MNVLLDTNVLSELRKIGLNRADPAVVRWAGRRSAPTLFLSVVTIMEVRIGIERLARRDPDQANTLRRWLEQDVIAGFARRIIPIDEAVATRCAPLHVPDRRPDLDALIAATALVHGLIVATRNVGDFAGTRCEIVNPWDETN